MANPFVLDQPVAPGGVTLASIAPMALLVIGGAYFLGLGKWRKNPSRKRGRRGSRRGHRR